LVVPGDYHWVLRNAINETWRRNAVLCVPAYWCEFSGEETPDDFREMRARYVPADTWSRKPHPSIQIRENNPRTGLWTDRYIRMSLKELLCHVEMLQGVPPPGFVYVMNFRSRVCRITFDPGRDEYVFRYSDKEDAEPVYVSGEGVEKQVWAFLVADTL